MGPKGIKDARIAFWFLRKVLPSHDHRNLTANFLELYKNILQEKGRIIAGIWIWGEIFKSLPGLFSASFFWRANMFVNYLKVTFRNLRRHKTYSFINLMGLAVGMAAFILILLYVQHEISFDRYNEHAHRIYRVAWKLSPGHTHSGKVTATNNFAVLGPTIVREFPEVVSAVRLKKNVETLLSTRDENFLEPNVYFADPEIFDIFSISLKKGDGKRALNNPDTIILSEKMAIKYFGDRNPIGEKIRYGTLFDLTVTGVLSEIPSTSHFSIDFIIPFKKYEQITEFDLKKWSYRVCLTYLLLSEEADAADLEEKLPSLFAKYMPDASPAQLVKHYLQPLTDIHLYSDCDGELGANNDIKNITIFMSIAFLILIIACINYMNLATARSVQRGQEVGIRKVVGAQRRQLIQQFLGESALLILMALLISLIIVGLALPAFNLFTEREIILDSQSGFYFLLLLIPVVTFVIFFSGIYPAFFLSSYSPVSILKGGFKGGTRGKRLRSFLVFMQFSISIFLMISTFVVKSQLNYIKNKDLGYQKEQIIVIRLNQESKKQLATIKTELKRYPKILSVSSSTYLPNPIHDTGNVNWPGRPENFKYFDVYVNLVDYDFVNLYQMDILAGRNFSRDFPSDAKGAFIFNEAMVKTLGWQSPIGREFIRDRFRNSSISGKVVGVVKDFNFHSLHRNIQPLYLFLSPHERQRRLSLKVKGDDIPATIGFLEKKMRSFAPSYPFEWNFFDAMFDNAYKSEQRIGSLFNLFTILAVFIASLGLFGLAAFTAEQRTKEIGIRKLLGAKMSTILALLSQEFIKWVLLSNFVAWPIAWFAMKNWLNNFAFRTPLGIWMFIASAVLALILAMVTIVFQVMKAANTKPVQALKYE